jgi:paraquat-inducible protein B
MTKTSLKSTWYLWLFPAFAVVLSVWLFANYLSHRGPTIKIALEDASGLQPEKTHVKFRGVSIGVVKEITISDDQKNAVAHISLERAAKHFATEGSRFWVVVPKVGFQGVSGLETLVEGTYLAAQPGPNPDRKKYEFKGQVGGESSDPLEDTVPYYLETDNVGAITVGDAVTFRGLRVGSVSKINLSKNSQSLIIQINIEDRYVKLVRTNTVFWRNTGVQAKLGLFNSELKINSLDSLLHSGIDMASPNAVGPIANAHTKFLLYPGAPKGVEKWNPILEFQ